MGCTRCEGPIEPGDLRCPTCGLAAVATEAVATVKVQVLRCHGCGAAVRYDAKVQAPRCAFCGNVLEIESVEDPQEQAQGAIPFTLDKSSVVPALKGWLRSLGWFRPSDLVASAKLEKLRPIFFAAWVCDAEAHVTWAADSEVGAHRSDWAPHSGECRLSFENIVISASRGLDAYEVASLASSYGPVLETMRREPEGQEHALVERFEVQRSEARQRIAQHLQKAAEARCPVPGSRKRNVHAELIVSKPITRRLLLPAWVMAYDYRGKLYRAVVSGVDGASITGSAPVSIWKILFVIAIVAAVTLGALALVHAL